MAFVMIATGATSRSRVRTLPVRPLIALAGVAALALLASGGAVGYWIAELVVRPAPAVPAVADAQATLPFTLEQVGAISARLFRLESEAAQLSKRIGVLNTEMPATPLGAGAPQRETASSRPARRRPAAGTAPTRRRRTSARSTPSSAASSSRSPASPASPRNARSSRCACRRACRSPAPS